MLRHSYAVSGHALISKHTNMAFSVYLTTDTWGQLTLLTTILNHKSCINTSRQVLEKTLFAINAVFLVKRALIANSVFFKTLSKSIYTSNMIKGGGQGGLKRKNY